MTPFESANWEWHMNAKISWHSMSQPPEFLDLKEKLCKTAWAAEMFQLSTCLTICQTKKLQTLVNMDLKSHQLVKWYTAERKGCIDWLCNLHLIHKLCFHRLKLEASKEGLSWSCMHIRTPKIKLTKKLKILSDENMEWRPVM